MMNSFELMDTLIPAQFLPLSPSRLDYTACDINKQNGGRGEKSAGIKVSNILS